MNEMRGRATRSRGTIGAFKQYKVKGQMMSSFFLRSTEINEMAQQFVAQTLDSRLHFYLIG